MQRTRYWLVLLRFIIAPKAKSIVHASDEELVVDDQYWVPSIRKSVKPARLLSNSFLTVYIRYNSRWVGTRQLPAGAPSSE